MPRLDVLFRVVIVGRREALDRFLVANPLEPQAVVRLDDGRVRMALFVNAEQRGELLALDIRIESEVELRARARDSLRQVGVGNRFADGGFPPGYGINQYSPR